MTNKKRKSLDDSLAHEFVYGESALPSNSQTQSPDDQETGVSPQEKQLSQKEKPPEPNPSKIIQSTKPSLMSQLQPEKPKEATIRLTVDLPESMHQKLSMLAARTRRKKAEIVRYLLDEALKDVKD